MKSQLTLVLTHFYLGNSTTWALEPTVNRGMADLELDVRDQLERQCWA